MSTTCIHVVQRSAVLADTDISLIVETQVSVRMTAPVKRDMSTTLTTNSKNN